MMNRVFLAVLLLTVSTVARGQEAPNAPVSPAQLDQWRLTRSIRSLTVPVDTTAATKVAPKVDQPPEESSARKDAFSDDEKRLCAYLWEEKVPAGNTTPATAAGQPPTGGSDSSGSKKAAGSKELPTTLENGFPMPFEHLLGRCIAYTAEAISGAGDPDGEGYHVGLIQLHNKNYKQVKWWSRAYFATHTATDLEGKVRQAEIHAALEALDEKIHSELRQHGLQEPFTASLFTGPAFPDVTKDVKGTTPAEGEETPTAAGDEKVRSVGIIGWQSKHFRDEQNGVFDFSVGGRLGYSPLLTLAKPQEDAKETSVVAQHRTGFLWDLGAQVNLGASRFGELSGFGRFGGTRIGDDPEVVDQGDNSFVAVPLDGTGGGTAWRWDTGLAFNYFRKPLEVLHMEKGLLNPLFHLSLGYRSDRRFKSSGDLSLGDHPERRYFFGFMLDAIKLVNPESIGEPSKPLTFGFAVEREWPAARKSLVPTSTRYMVRGQINLLRALTGKADAAPEENGAGDGGGK